MFRHLLTASLAIATTAACSDAPAAPAAPPPAAVKPAAPPAAAAPPAKTEIAVPKITISTAQADIDQGKGVFAAKGCSACHKVDDTKLVGPGLKGVTARRDQEWIMKMILKPEIMLKEDETARKLLAQYFTPMPAQGVNPETELPALMAYLKSIEK